MSYILIAEDDRDISLIIQRNLEISGYRDIWMTSYGDEALEKALSDVPQLMILDVMLPRMNGLKVCKDVKAKLGDKAPPIIMTTALGRHEDIEGGKDAGADAYVVKPFSPRDLVDQVKTLIDSYRIKALDAEQSPHNDNDQA